MEELTLAIGDIIVGIDIGTSKVSTVVGEVNNFNQIEIICSTICKCNGMKKGKMRTVLPFLIGNEVLISPFSFDFRL